MDLSKLPKMSSTPKPADNSAPIAAANPTAGHCTQCGAELGEGMRFCGKCGSATGAGAAEMPGAGAEIWLSAVLGIVFMVLGQTAAQYAIATVTGRDFHTGINWTGGPKAGTEVAYFELAGYTAFTDTAVFLFGLAMVLEAVGMLAISRNIRGKRPVLGVALGVTVLATGFNAWVGVMVFMGGMLPLISMLATAFGAYIGAYQWGLWKQIRRA